MSLGPQSERNNSAYLIRVSVGEDYWLSNKRFPSSKGVTVVSRSHLSAGDAHFAYALWRTFCVWVTWQPWLLSGSQLMRYGKKERKNESSDWVKNCCPKPFFCLSLSFSLSFFLILSFSFSLSQCISFVTFFPLMERRRFIFFYFFSPSSKGEEGK